MIQVVSRYRHLHISTSTRIRLQGSNITRRSSSTNFSNKNHNKGMVHLDKTQQAVELQSATKEALLTTTHQRLMSPIISPEIAKTSSMRARSHSLILTTRSPHSLKIEIPAIQTAVVISINPWAALVGTSMSPMATPIVYTEFSLLKEEANSIAPNLSPCNKLGPLPTKLTPNLTRHIPRTFLGRNRRQEAMAH